MAVTSLIINLIGKTTFLCLTVLFVDIWEYPDFLRHYYLLIKLLQASLADINNVYCNTGRPANQNGENFRILLLILRETLAS